MKFEYSHTPNSKLTTEQQKESFKHEVNHIMNNDFDGGDNNDIDEIEYLAHKYN